MLKHNESKGNFKGVTAAEVSAAIRYRDSGPMKDVGIVTTLFS
jgi:hypothetical protein